MVCKHFTHSRTAGLMVAVKLGDPVDARGLLVAKAVDALHSRGRGGRREGGGLRV